MMDEGEVVPGRPSTVVMKFGGTSVATVDLMNRAAQRVQAERERDVQVVVVVSAMGDTTDRLVQQMQEVGASFDAREYDVLLASGEQLSAALMTSCLQQRGISARSWLGWQIPIHTDGQHGMARIESIGVDRLQQRLDEGMTAVCAGFQGIDQRNRITTLGRGGSDTSAVALAIALGAVRCDIYTDVDGVFTCDPRLTPQARLIRQISAEEMLELATLGASVLHPRSVRLAMRFAMPLTVRSALGDDPGTVVRTVGSSNPSSMVRMSMPIKKGSIMERADVTGLATTDTEALITVVGVKDTPGVAARVFGAIAQEGIDVDMIIQSSSRQGLADMSFTLPLRHAQRAQTILETQDGLVFSEILINKDVVKVSVVGVGMQNNPGVAYRIFHTLSEHNINILAISTSEIKVSLLIDRNYAELTLRVLHAVFAQSQQTPPDIHHRLEPSHVR